MICFENVTRRFPDGSLAVDGLDLNLQAGHLTVLVGPSGCGKTTTLRLINRLDEPTAGRVTVDGRDIGGMPVTELRRGIGYVMQHSGLFPHRTVSANIATVPRLLGWKKRRIAQRVHELVALVGLRPEIMDRYPHQLSGGQQQRVGVARALAADPPILLMDEPFAAVDPIVRKSLQDELLALQSRISKTIVFVTHDIDEAIRLGDRIAVMSQHAQVAQFAPPEQLLAAPANDFIVDFLGGEPQLKRLSLMSADQVASIPAPVIKTGATVDAARVAARQANTDWLLVLDDADHILGWHPLDAYMADPDRNPERFEQSITCKDTLRTAQDMLLASRLSTVARLDNEGRFDGLLNQLSLNRAVQ